MLKVAPGPNNGSVEKPPPRPSRSTSKKNESRPPQIDAKELGNKSSDDEEKQVSKNKQKKGKLSRKLSDQLKATKVAPDPKTPNSKDPPATPTPT